MGFGCTIELLMTFIRTFIYLTGSIEHELMSVWYINMCCEGWFYQLMTKSCRESGLQKSLICSLVIFCSTSTNGHFFNLKRHQEAHREMEQTAKKCLSSWSVQCLTFLIHWHAMEICTMLLSLNIYSIDQNDNTCILHCMLRYLTGCEHP